MKVRILGCGAAAGVPGISFGWGRCNPANPRNRRLRPSILVSEGDVRILVDTTPDLREQLLAAGEKRLDGVLYTHAHADHIHGIDDLREVNRAMAGPVHVYATAEVIDTLTHRFAYVFGELDPAKYPVYKPMLIPHAVSGRFDVAGVEVVAYEQDHGYMKSTGFRFGRLAYSTDLVDMPDESFDTIAGVDVWIVSCILQGRSHETHAHLEKVLDWVERVRPRRTILTHMGASLDYDELRSKLPPSIEPAYDGMEFEV